MVLGDRYGDADGGNQRSVSRPIRGNIGRLTSTLWGNRPMFSMAVRGYGIVIWDGGGQWRMFCVDESRGAMLAARVESALDALPPSADEWQIREALLSISGAGLLSADCEHGPGECDGEIGIP
ncbi:hypothetical protein BH23CHL10_BH23CHL10_05940 [soil metagenome]